MAHGARASSRPAPDRSMAGSRSKVEAYWEQNPALKEVSDANAYSEGAGLTTIETYTVPTGKRAMIVGGTLSLMVRAAFTNTTVTNVVETSVLIDDSTTSVLQNIIRVPIVTVSANDHFMLPVMAGHVMNPGTDVKIRSRAEGTGGGAGRIHIVSAVAMVEFDA